MNVTWLISGVGFIGFVVITLFVVKALLSMYRKVEQGQALIINTMKGEPTVRFTGGIVYPVINKAETMDISVKTIEIDRRSKEGLICQDNIRADIKVTFFVKVNKTAEDVLKVAQQVSCARASDQDTLEALFQAKFSEALKTVGKQLNFVELYTQRDNFKDEIIRTIGTDLNGYVLDDAAIDYLEQTPVETLDPQNILDAQGIRKITRLTTEQNVETNELRQTERKAITKQNVEAEEAVLALQRQEADARAKQEREIATLQARETAETEKVQAEENRRSELARIKAEEEIQVQAEAKERQIAVAQKAKERAIAVENERVEKDRALEAISRERETELQRIAKEKEIEVEKKAIADVVRSRIAVDKTVAEEEERIKDLRAVAEAKRLKEVAITGAEAEAQQGLVKETKAAEARQEVAKHAAKERMTLADAAMEAADREAKAKIRLAEGVQAEVAAEGMARVKVREADAVAYQKEGDAKATVTRTQLEAEAKGEEEKGLAEVRVKEAEAEAIQKLGMAEAAVTRQKLFSEAKGQEEKGLSEARVQEANAVAHEKMGLAEAVAIEKQLAAEAAGLAEKATAMKALDQDSRAHEEYRLRLTIQKDVELAKLETQKSLAIQRAEILKEAMSAAKINIVGGDGAFFDRFVNAVAVGQSVDAMVDNSESVQNAFGGYLNGDKNLPEDVLQALQGMGGQGLQNLSVSAFLTKLMSGADADTRGKLESLLSKVKELGLEAPNAKSN